MVVKVDAEGLSGRIAVLPPPASGYGDLTSVGDKLYFQRKGKLFVYDLEKEKETEIRSISAPFKPAIFATSIWDETLFRVCI